MQQAQTQQVWRNDSELEEKLGEWWTQEMELRDDSTSEMSCGIANAELASRGYSMMVLECREAESGDNCDWLCVEVVEEK